jgi:hypothetical protein
MKKEALAPCGAVAPKTNKNNIKLLYLTREVIYISINVI